MDHRRRTVWIALRCFILSSMKRTRHCLAVGALKINTISLDCHKTILEFIIKVFLEEIQNLKNHLLFCLGIIEILTLIPGYGKTHKDAASVRATHPIPSACGLYYFEVKIVSKGRDGYVLYIDNKCLLFHNSSLLV